MSVRQEYIMESFVSDYVAVSEGEDEPDETDSCDVDNSVFNEDDDEEASLANSGSDLDLSQSKADFGDKIRIQATKEELTDAFKQKLYILQSEKKWFHKGCELKRTIGDTIKVLRDVYKGFSSTHGDLPKASLNEFRIELGNILSDTKLVRKLCNVVCKMYPRGYRIDNDYLYVDFENAFDFLIGLSDASSVVAQEVASQEVVLDNLFQMMEYTRGQMLNETLCAADAELQKKAFECLHNIAMDHRNYQKLRNKNFVDMIASHFENESGSHEAGKMQAGTVLNAFGALAALIDERESEAGGRQTEVVGFFKEKLKESLKVEDDESWSPRKIVRTIRRLAQNDCYKKAFGRCNILPMLVEVAKRDSIRDQRESTGAIWALSFIEENQKKILENQEAMELLQLKRESSYTKISKNCQGTLWNMRSLLSNQRHYRHLVSWSSSIDETQNNPSDTNNNDTRGNNTDNGQCSAGHIMISYQWSNQKTLIKISHVLKSKGYKVWLDIDNMSGSTLEAMAEAVEKASVVLICMSQKYKNSPNCRLEAEYAFQQGKTIIPLKMEKGYRADGWLGLLIGTKLFFEFSGKYPFDEKVKDLLRELATTVPIVEEKKTVTFSGADQNVDNNSNTTMTLRRQKTEPFISLSQLNALKSAFSLFDFDDSDRLSVSELGDVLRSVGLNPTQAEIDDIMENADCDGNGFIDYTEYISLLKSYMKPQTEIEKELKDSFKLFSRGSGKVNLRQLRLALTKLGEKMSENEAEELFDMMDENEDGVVDIDADPHVEVRKLATLVKNHGVSPDYVNEVLTLVKKPTKLADEDVKEIFEIVIAILKNKQKHLVKKAEEIMLAMKKSKSLNWKQLLPEAREMMKVIGELPVDNKDIVDKYEDFLKKLLDLLKKGKALQVLQSSLVDLFFNCILVKMPAKAKLADECSVRDIMDFSKDAAARLDALERCEILLKMEDLPKDNNSICWAVGNITERITESYDRNGKAVTEKENELLLSIFKTVGEGADTIVEQFYQEDNEDIPNVYLKPWRDALNEYVNAHQSSRTLECIAPIMPNILKWAKIAIDDDDDNWIHWTFGKLSLVGLAPPEEFKDYLPEIVDLMIWSEKYQDLFMFVTSMYPHKPKAVHDRLQDFLDRFVDLKEGDRGHLTYILYIVAQQHPEAFSRDQISSMFDHYKISSGQSQTTLLSVIHNISQKHPKQLAHFLPQLCDDSIFQPETMNFRSAIISSVGGLNEDLGQKAVDYLIQYADFKDSTISLIVVGQLSTMVREHVEYMQKHKQKLEELERTATQPQVKDMVHDMILELEGKSIENIAEDVQQQQEDLEELDTKVDATIDTVIAVGDKVIQHDKEIGELEEGLEKMEERVDDVEEDMDEAKIKIEEIDNKTMSNAPKWSRDLTKLMNPEADNDWRLLGSRLGYSNDDIRGWATQHDPCMALLSEWYATHKTSEANYGVMNALTEMDRMDCVAIVENAMKVAEDVIEDEEFEYASPPPVFISYQWGFQNEVKLLKHHLNMAGYECWLDVGQMGGGDKLFAKIDNGIRGAKIVICCVTEKYAQSPNCNREVNLSVNLNKPIIPLLMEKMDWPPKGSMGPIFSEYLFIRFFQRGGEETPENDQRYWPIPKFQELLMQLNFFVVPDQKLVAKEYASWWAPMVDDIKVDKNKGKKQDANKPKTNEKQVMQPEISPLVFLSYQWGKQPQVKALYQRLTSLGYTVWMDIYQMGGGDSLYDKIDRGMRGCKAVVSCVTQKYSLSANCRRELSLADALKKPIIPLLLEQMKWPPDGPMSMVFTELLYINFHRDEAPQMTWTGEQYEELKSKLSQFIPDVVVSTESQERVQRPGKAKPNTIKAVSARKAKEVAISEGRKDKFQRPTESQDKTIKPVNTGEENVARSLSPNKTPKIVTKTGEKESRTNTDKDSVQSGNTKGRNTQITDTKKGVLARAASVKAVSVDKNTNQSKDSTSNVIVTAKRKPINSSSDIIKTPATGAAEANSENADGQNNETITFQQSVTLPKSPDRDQLYSATVGDEYINSNINEDIKQPQAAYPDQLKTSGNQKKSSSCIII